MATEQPQLSTTTATTNGCVASTPQAKRYRSIFDVSEDFFEACRLLSPSAASVPDSFEKSENPAIVVTADDSDAKEDGTSSNGVSASRWTCHTCKVEFESLEDQRSHFKSDFHRINVKLSIAGKHVVKEEDFDELAADSFRDSDISSISGSEDEAEADKVCFPRNNIQIKQKLFIRLRTGERVSLWKCLVLNESESVCYENDKAVTIDDGGNVHGLRESEVVERLKPWIHNPRDESQKDFRIVLLASGGHFAGCVFTGDSVVAHKTFHRYVVRAKAGKKQSSKDAGGRAAHSAGASLRRYNELALKKDIQELLADWKPYFDASSCIFIHAPSSNRQLFFDGDKAFFGHHRSAIRNVPLNVRRPTFKEARHIYNQLTQVAYEVDEQEVPLNTKSDLVFTAKASTDGSLDHSNEDLKETLTCRDANEASSAQKALDELSITSDCENEVVGRTPLHDAAESGDADKVLELLEQGLDPCIKDERGRTSYMLADEKEVRNTFRRFMASNLDKWDWQAAKVPSALTQEMEESQAAKQAEKDAKRKARAKELKKLRKAKEKQAQAQAATLSIGSAVKGNQAAQHSVIKGQSQHSGGSQISKEEELKRAQAAEREKRAAAAERRMAALIGQASATTTAPSTTQSRSGLGSDQICSCCNASLAGKIPFHRYHYKYCSTSCMHVHKEILEDG